MSKILGTEKEWERTETTTAKDLLRGNKIFSTQMNRIEQGEEG